MVAEKRVASSILATSCLAVAIVAVGSAQTSEQSAQSDARLVRAVQEQHSTRIQHLINLLNEGVDVNATRADGVTALLWAAHWDDQATADLLLEAGADPNAAEDQGVTPLARAAENTSVAMVSKLLAAGADPNRAQANGMTPLITAARTGNVPVIATLLEAGAQVSVRTEETGQTALMWATGNGHHDAVEMLLAAGADVHAQSDLGFTPLLFATRNNDLEMARTLIAAGADVNQSGSDGTYPVALAIVSGHADFVRFLLGQGADPNGTMHGVGALHAAAGNVDIWIRDWLRTRYVGINMGGRETTGLQAGERFPIVTALLEAGADPNARIDVFTTMESWVSGKNGARDNQSIGTGDLSGATPLWIAAYVANRTQRLFIDNGRQVQPENLEGVDGMQSEEARVVRALLDAGADPALATADGTTPLMVAAGLGHSTYVKAPESLPSPPGEAAVRLLAESGADVNRTNEAGFTALHGAAFRGLSEVVEYLVAHGADIDAQDFRQRTAYSIALGTQQSVYMQEWPGLAARLLELGADATVGLGGRDHERELSRQRAAGSDKP